MTVAVIRFPGSNCEKESVQALNKLGIDSRIIEWNFNESMDQFTGFLLPGGFSYQDRIRAGVIASKLPIMKKIKLESDKKKPILGICNGAQILVESGLFSTTSSLDQIIDFNYVDNRSIGFLCDWGFLSPFNASQNIFLQSFSDHDVLPIQICHGEGRFIFSSPPPSGLRYVSIEGVCSNAFPITPNGSTENIAAISNASGNALAIMPHPERSQSPSRYPFSIQTYAKKNQLKLVDFTQLFHAFKEPIQ